MRYWRMTTIAAMVLALGLAGGCHQNKVPEGTVKSEVFEDDAPAEKAPAEEAMPEEAAPAETPAEAPAEAAAEAPAETAEAPAADAVYVISPNDDSFIEFVGYKVTGNQPGGFANFSGEVTVPGGDLTKAQVSVKVDLTTVYTKTNILTETLKGKDFFEIGTFPEASFTSTEITQDGDGYKVVGNFDLHGFSKKIGFPAKIEMKDGNVVASAEFSIDRNLWEISYDGVTDDAIRDDVLIKFEVVAEPQA
ncbi:MAG: YceI family protein [Candidatus Hydrogenedens sp.]|nr:YceI family protein [Candidatus Hydrogenedens sp.]